MNSWKHDNKGKSLGQQQLSCFNWFFARFLSAAAAVAVLPCTPTTHSSSRVAFENVHRRRRRQLPQTTTAAKCSSQQQLSHRKSKIVHLATTVLGCRKPFTQHSLTVHFSMQPVSPFAPFLEQDVTSLFSDLLHRSSCNRNVKYNLFHKKKTLNAEKLKKKNNKLCC